MVSESLPFIVVVRVVACRLSLSLTTTLLALLYLLVSLSLPAPFPGNSLANAGALLLQLLARPDCRQCLPILQRLPDHWLIWPSIRKAHLYNRALCSELEQAALIARERHRQRHGDELSGTSASLPSASSSCRLTAYLGLNGSCISPNADVSGEPVTRARRGRCRPAESSG